MRSGRPGVSHRKTLVRLDVFEWIIPEFRVPRPQAGHLGAEVEPTVRREPSRPSFFPRFAFQRTPHKVRCSIAMYQAGRFGAPWGRNATSATQFRE